MSHAAIVLCGGRSSRMGRPKAWLPWFGRTMIEHVVDRLASVVDEVVVVTSESLDLPALPARIVRDREPERGPLAGIRDGLAVVDSELAFVTSTDAPFLRSDFVERALSLGRACAPLSDGHVEVLCAVYPSRAWKNADRLLDAGVGRPLRLLESLDFEEIAPDADDSPPPWRGFNTPQAYLDCVRSVDDGATAQVELLGRAALAVDDTIRSVPVGTLGEALSCWPDSLGLMAEGRVARSYIASLGGRDLVRDLGVPVGPGERVSLLDALAGG